MPDYPFREKKSDDIDERLLALLRAAVLALRAEDAELATRFASAPAALAGDYRKSSQGLAHSVFETALVYEIFKAWIPLAYTEWECNYETGARKVDLAVWPTTSARTIWIFEAKWWSGMSQKHLGLLDADCSKMLEWAKATARYLITFWYNEEENWDEDCEAAESYCTRKQSGYTARAIYMASFPTDWERARAKKGAYFAMGVFAIEPTRGR